MSGEEYEEPRESDSQERRHYIPAFLFESLRLGEWVRQAACGGRDDLDFDAPDRIREKQAKAVCAGCPVRIDCLTAAMRNQEPIGIWGGLNTEERIELARQRKLPEPRTLPPHATNARYARHGCRCTPCRQAHTHAVAEHRRIARRRNEQPNGESEAG